MLDKLKAIPFSKLVLLLKLLPLLKYARHIELFETVGAAIQTGLHGDDFVVTRDVSVQGRLKSMMISLHDKYPAAPSAATSEHSDPFNS